MSRLLLLMALVGGVAHAQEGPPPASPPAPLGGVPFEDDVLYEDRTVLTDTLAARSAPDSLLAAYRADPTFQYDRPEAEGPSLWERFWQWVGRTFLDPIFDNTTASFRDWVFVILGVLALAWVVTRLLRAEGGSPFGRRDERRGGAGPLLDIEDIEAVDLHALLAEALSREAYREAVRYRYLVLLQRLAEAGVIAWRRDKTNREYVLEARAHDSRLGRPFTQATRVFDYVWYGERAVDGHRYAALDPTFKAVERALIPQPVAS